MTGPWPRARRLTGGWARLAIAAGVTVGVAVAPAQADSAPAGPLPAQLRSRQAIPIAYNQGIARVPGGWILSGTNYPKPASDVLVRTDEQFNVLATNRGAIPAEYRAQRYVHIGDIDVVGDVIYAPFEEPDYSLGHQVTARYDARTLRFLDAVVLPQHENSFVAVDPATLIAYSMDHFDGNTVLRYDVAHGWRSLPPLGLPVLLHHTQGGSIAGGAIWICTSDDHNDLYRVSLKTGQVDLVGQITQPQGEGEGIDVTALASGRLHAMVIDPDQTKVWIEHFDVPAALVAVPSSSHAGLVVAAAIGLVVVAAGAAWLVRRRVVRNR